MIYINLDLIFDAANVVFLIGSLLLIWSIYKDRNVLKGFQPMGSILTFVAMCMVQFNYFQMENAVSFLFSLPTVALWALASGYSTYNYFRNKKKESAVKGDTLIGGPMF